MLCSRRRRSICCANDLDLPSFTVYLQYPAVIVAVTAQKANAVVMLEFLKRRRLLS